MSKFTGYEIVTYLDGTKAYGFGLLQKWGYIDAIPSPEEWREWSQEQRHKWVYETNLEITRRVGL